MIPRYFDPKIDQIWSDGHKTKLWQQVESAVIRARENLGLLEKGIDERVLTYLTLPIDIDRWHALEKEMKHDLNAFVFERREKLPVELQHRFHEDMTSYDTEEAAFAQMLKDSCVLAEVELGISLAEIQKLALRYRYTPMVARTHGQEAKLQTFGKRCLTWHEELAFAIEQFHKAQSSLSLSRLSGAVGNYSAGLTPEIEKEALRILGFNPFAGATQIMPRVLFAPLAQSLELIGQVVAKVAEDLRLMARSGNPLCHEPFGKKQTGSSAMPHKKNPINCEKICGMVRMISGRAKAIVENIRTTEERAIEQSCVERVDWPDIFHLVIHVMKTLTRVLKGLVVYPDNMMKEIVQLKGLYASDEAKNFLGKLLAQKGFGAEIAYRMVQLASFQLKAPDALSKDIRGDLPISLDQADHWLGRFYDEDKKDLNQKLPEPGEVRAHLCPLIAQGKLKAMKELDHSSETISEWNRILRDVFDSTETKREWYFLFRPSNLLANEAHLFKEVFGV